MIDGKPSRSKLLLVWLICQVANLVCAIWALCAIAAGSPRAWRIAVGYDQLANATFGGDEDETISSRCWRYRDEPGYAQWVRLINWLAGDPEHCKNAFESEGTKRQPK
ncbi:MAG: hypothetical protein NT159_01455 [Proteobacteria bacterium]|nr:hypothetical protein [Pseudomonadota bacterium]